MTPALISELTHVTIAFDARYPDVAMDASGNAMVVWDVCGEGSHHVFANYFDGTSWGTDPYFLDYAAGYGPKIAMNADGNVQSMPMSAAI